MSYMATALKVMIASPGDVENERRTVREVIQEWNFVHSEDKTIVLMPVGWETHSSPSMKASAQEIVNKQVLVDCDLLIAVFWHRIGTPTGEYISGTVEEINKHIHAEKPTMIYFSSAPVEPDKVDSEQYSALKEFRDDLKRRGLVENYKSLPEFRGKLTRNLAQTVISEFADSADESSMEEIITEPTLRPSISDDGSDLLISAVRDGNGTILAIRTMGGQSVHVGNKEFVERGNPRSEARWIKALEELVRLNYIRDTGYTGEVYDVTADGYDVADALLLES